MGEYTYCARAWWLRRVAGEQPAGAARRTAGVVAHARHGHRVARARLAWQAGLLLLLLGLILLALA